MPFSKVLLPAPLAPIKVTTSPRLTFDAINLTDEAQRQTFEYSNAAFTYYKPGRAFLIGIRGKF